MCLIIDLTPFLLPASARTTRGATGETTARSRSAAATKTKTAARPPVATTTTTARSSCLGSGVSLDSAENRPFMLSLVEAFLRFFSTNSDVCGNRKRVISPALPAQAKILFSELPRVVTPNPGIVERGPEIRKFFNIFRRDVRRSSAGLSYLQCDFSQRVKVQGTHRSFFDRLTE